MLQKTLREEIIFSGIGIHTGLWSRIVLHPEPAGTGIRFLRKGTYIDAHVDNVVSTNHATDLAKEGVRVKTVEHILAVLHLLGVDNLTVELVEGVEIPIMDGGGGVFYDTLKEAVEDLGTEAEVFKIPASLRVEEGSSFIWAEPSDRLEIEYMGTFKNFLGERHFRFTGEPEEIVYARTFCYYDEIPLIKGAGLGKGGNLDNTLVLLDKGVLNEGGMFYEDEPVRHKVLDIMGDLYLLGKPIVGKIISRRGGHYLNVKLIKMLKELATEGKLSHSLV